MRKVALEVLEARGLEGLTVGEVARSIHRHIASNVLDGIRT
jgi:hypothetical protein